MKVFEQIPCLNEEQTLPSVLASIPLAIDGLPLMKAVQRLGSNVAKRILIEEQLERIKEIQYRV